jgi:hypothetical protein
MPDITEFSPDGRVEIIKVGGEDAEVRGISARALATVARRYPLIMDMLNGKTIDANDSETQLSILEMAPTLVAFASRRQNDEDSIADALSFTEAFPAALKIISLTVAEGKAPGPLAENGEQLTEALVTK